MDGLFKRVLAYLIDMILVSFVVSSIASSHLVNFQLDDYEKNYKEYAEVVTSYYEHRNNKIKSCDDLAKAIKDKKLTEEKYVSRYEKITEDKEELKDEFDSKCLVIVDDYNSAKMSDDEYREEIKYLSYNVEKKLTFTYLTNVITCILYFVFFQGFTGGQTLGKKIMRLKVVSYDDSEVSYKQLFIRTLFLYSTVYNFIVAISAHLVPLNFFYEVSNVLYFINYTLSIVLLFTVSTNYKRRGLHDIVAKTRVKMMDFKGNEIEEKYFFNTNSKKEVKNKSHKRK